MLATLVALLLKLVKFVFFLFFIDAKSHDLDKVAFKVGSCSLNSVKFETNNQQTLVRQKNATNNFVAVRESIQVKPIQSVP